MIRMTDKKESCSSSSSSRVSSNEHHLVTCNPKLVRAIYNFKGTNNDELCMMKDDLITLTQTPDGGWWEGTLNSVTGWFPSNYVVSSDVPISGNGDTHEVDGNVMESGMSGVLEGDIQQYRNMVYKDIMDTEAAYLRELSDTLNKYLLPLQQMCIVNESDISTVIHTIQTIYSIHRQFLASLTSLNSVPYKDSRIGGIFIDFAQQIKNAHFEYCALHAKFVHLIEQHKKEITPLFVTPSVSGVESMSGVVTLTTFLSITFRRLDKYPALLQELHRYTEESHSDRGDTQRAGFVYREISMSCLELRRRKEMELEVLLGNIKNWEGESIQNYGEIIRMSAISLQNPLESEDIKKDKYLVLFPQVLLILSISSEMNSFILEAKSKLDDVVVKLNETDSARFELEMHDKRTFIVICGDEAEVKEWMNLIQKGITSSCKQQGNNSLSESQTKPSLSSSISDSSSTSNVILRSTRQTGSFRHKYWTNKSLMSHPPLRMCNNLNGNNSQVNSKSPEVKHNDDMMILQVIESYCQSSKSRKTNNSTSESSPQILIAEEEKLFDECNQNLDEKGLIDAMLLLQDDMKQIKSEIKLLANGLKAERKSRKKLNNLLEELVKKA